MLLTLTVVMLSCGARCTLPRRMRLNPGKVSRGHLRYLRRDLPHQAKADSCDRAHPLHLFYFRMFILLLSQATLGLVRSAVSQGDGVRRQTGWQRALSWIGVAGLLLVSWSAMVSKVGEEPCRREHRMKVVFDLL
jgi:hypothetical protein